VITAVRHLREISRAYAPCPASARMRVLGRYVLCPFASLLGVFPPTGRILDIGCGDGLLLLLLSLEDDSRARGYVGIDVDEHKIANARRARIANTDFRIQDVSMVPAETFDCVSIIDVLYLLPISRWDDFLRQSMRALRRDGLLIVKEVTNTPCWKYWIGYLEELLAIKLIRMTHGDTPHLESIDTYQASLETAGADVINVRRVDAGRPVAHVLFVAKKP